MLDLARQKVCFVAGTLGQGGAERQLFYILQVLCKAGASVRVLCLTRGEFWEEPIRGLGVPVTHVGRRRSRAARLARIVGELGRDRPDIVQSQHFYVNFYTAWAACLVGLPDVGAIRNTASFGIETTGRLSGQFCLRAPRLIAANSRAAIAEGIALGVPETRMYFLPNAVDADRFHPVTREGRRSVRILAAGRLVPQKRFDRFVGLVSRLRQECGMPIVGTLVGSGPLRAELARQAAALGLPEDVLEFRDAVADMTAVYQETDLLVLTSDAEGTPNVVLEAMASGLPVVAPRVGGIPEVVQDGTTGFMFDPASADQLDEAVRRLVENPELRRDFGGRGRALVLARHSFSALSGALTGLYAEALS